MLTILVLSIAMFLVTSPIVVNVPARGLLAVVTMHAIVQCLTNLNIKRNMTSMFLNKKHRYSVDPVQTRTILGASAFLKRTSLYSFITFYRIYPRKCLEYPNNITTACFIRSWFVSLFACSRWSYYNSYQISLNFMLLISLSFFENLREFVLQEIARIISH